MNKRHKSCLLHQLQNILLKYISEFVYSNLNVACLLSINFTDKKFVPRSHPQTNYSYNTSIILVYADMPHCPIHALVKRICFANNYDIKFNLTYDRAHTFEFVLMFLVMTVLPGPYYCYYC